jgi:flavin reductase (DIM6/NTAB) family NADH-FMN oxidoreductase RutF
MVVDSKTFREALGRFATGVSVVTAPAANGGAVGVTISSFTSLSLEPPLVLFCIGRASTSHRTLVASPVFGVNILSADQERLSEVFAGAADDKFDGLAVSAGLNGVPLLAGCLANLECCLIAVHPGGDHDIVVGQVEAVHLGEGEPLLRFRGGYRQIAGDVERPAVRKTGAR